MYVLYVCSCAHNSQGSWLSGLDISMVVCFYYVAFRVMVTISSNGAPGYFQPYKIYNSWIIFCPICIITDLSICPGLTICFDNAA